MVNFEFDAPQFEDFTHPRYYARKQALESIIKGETTISSTWTITEHLSSDNDEWFQTHHSSHEYSQPDTPTGPLLMTDSSGGSSFGSSQRSSNSPASRLAKTKLRGKAQRITAINSVPENTSPSSPPTFSNSKSFNIINNSSTTNNYSSPLSKANTVSHRNVSSITRGNRVTLSSPTRTPTRSKLPLKSLWSANSSSDFQPHPSPKPPRNPQTDDSVRDSLSIEGDPRNMLTFSSSIPGTPPTLDCGMVFSSVDCSPGILGFAGMEAGGMEANGIMRKRSLPFSPLSVNPPPGAPPIKPVRRLVSKPLRVIAVNEPTKSIKDVLPIKLPEKQRTSPVLKRQRFLSRQNSPAKDRQPPPSKFAANPANSRAPKIDDVRKLLAQHNQKIRPRTHRNITRRR